jgi:hypothetical protein
LRDFWATIADGDAVFDYPQFPQKIRHYIQTYSAATLIDNNSTLLLEKMERGQLGVGSGETALREGFPPQATANPKGGR